jgi:hypothetical protein
MLGGRERDDVDGAQAKQAKMAEEFEAGQKRGNVVHSWGGPCAKGRGVRWCTHVHMQLR